VKIAFIGDGNNNVVRSLAFLCAKLDVSLKIASPEKYELPTESLELAVKIAKSSTCIEQKRDPMEVIRDADIVYTDTWVSMGREAETETRRNDFKTYQVNSQLMASAKQGAFVMHCLPAHRGEEITDGVIDGPRSIVYDQAENRLHLQKALLKFLIYGKENNY
jgi:ornithine carbamoyltransferase